MTHNVISLFPQRGQPTFPSPVGEREAAKPQGEGASLHDAQRQRYSALFADSSNPIVSPEVLDAAQRVREGIQRRADLPPHERAELDLMSAAARAKDPAFRSILTQKADQAAHLRVRPDRPHVFALPADPVPPPSDRWKNLRDDMCAIVIGGMAVLALSMAIGDAAAHYAASVTY